jgi:alkanesulfonate monooxygenase SsuD/methylene tetrahydromethanopterin reductase-like flavin-dependent oxidoreductase (luciferase family)
MTAYWNALEGTIDPQKVESAADNALIGDAEEVAAQIARFHPDDRLMLWFDFFQHDSARVVRNMTAFMERVRPLIDAATAP